MAACRDDPIQCVERILIQQAGRQRPLQAVAGAGGTQAAFDHPAERLGRTLLGARQRSGIAGDCAMRPADYRLIS